VHQKVWKVDLLNCPHCQGEMKSISFIKDPDAIRKILRTSESVAHPETSPSTTATQSMPPVTEQEEFFDDGWPGYEEPVFSVD